MSTKENKSGLWDNDMVKSALKSMSPADIERYQKIGESMYKDLNFETSCIENKNNMPPFMVDALAYIEESLNSGLHPSMLSDDDKNILNEAYGKIWYKKWGYVEGDLTDIVTIEKK